MPVLETDISTGDLLQQGDCLPSHMGSVNAKMIAQIDLFPSGKGITMIECVDLSSAGGSCIVTLGANATQPFLRH